MAILKTLNSNGEILHISDDAMPISAYQDYPIPIIYFSGNAAGMTKDDAVTLNYTYKERSGTCTLKWQGSSAIHCAKKNYTIKFDNEFEVVSGWGAQKKYVLKANYVDSSHARNVVCAKLWGQIVKSRTPANATLNALPNGGAVDGFPVIVSLNGNFHGLYTWNIPKDGWMFGMDGTGKQAIVCAEGNNNGAVAFKGLATFTEDSNGQLDFDVEYSSDDQTDWVLTSLNRLLAAVKDSDGTNIEYGITPYLDWESAIDYYIHATLTANYDGIWRNYLLATYDGVKWFFTGYDMDVVLGLRSMGKYFYAANNTEAGFAINANAHALFGLIWKYMRPQLRARYNELRAAAMSVENVANMFVDFVAEIPLPVYVDDVRLWNSIPSNSANNLAQIITYYDFRCRAADKWITSTSGETAMPEQVNPSVYTVTNALTNCGTSNSADTVDKDAAYSATITPASGYELESVTVTMGGVDITSTAYADGVITISAVTGNLVITATATEIVVAGYTNQIPISTDENGNIYNGVGYLENTRVGSDGTNRTGQSNRCTFGYIPCKAGDIIRFCTDLGEGNLWSGASGMQATSFNFYKGDAAKTNLGQLTSQPAGYGIFASNFNVESAKVTHTGAVYSYTVPNNADIAFVRMTLPIDCPQAVNSGGENYIITINQEIT